MLWDEITVIQGNGGWLTIRTGEQRTCAVEVPRGSSLPAKLADLGYTPATLRHRYTVDVPATPRKLFSRLSTFSKSRWGNDRDGAQFSRRREGTTASGRMQ